jgi:hypothetical protein
MLDGGSSKGESEADRRYHELVLTLLERRDNGSSFDIAKIGETIAGVVEIARRSFPRLQDRVREVIGCL